jgi:hypothetical protein
MAGVAAWSGCIRAASPASNVRPVAITSGGGGGIAAPRNAGWLDSRSYGGCRPIPGGAGRFAAATGKPAGRHGQCRHLLPGCRTEWPSRPIRAARSEAATGAHRHGSALPMGFRIGPCRCINPRSCLPQFAPKARSSHDTRQAGDLCRALDGALILSRIKSVRFRPRLPAAARACGARPPAGYPRAPPAPRSCDRSSPSTRRSPASSARWYAATGSSAPTPSAA